MCVELAAPAVRAIEAPPRPWARMLEVIALLVMLAVALAIRLNDLEGPRSSFPDLFDEGIRAEQLLLMEHGFRPFRDIYSSQGLLLLPLLYPFYALFGGTLGAIRLGVGLISVVGLLGAWWSLRQIVGGLGALAAVLLLVTSQSFSEASRLALAEVPSLVPCLWAVGCGLRWVRGGSPRWLYVAAALATVGVLIKPMAISIAVPLALCALLRPGLRLQHLLVAAGVVLGITALAVLAMGPTEVWQQIVEYRKGAREAASWDPRRNYKLVVVEPFQSQPGLYLLALVSAALVLAWSSWRAGLALVVWPLAAAGLLVLYYPLHPKHLVYLVPPLALLAGAGLGRAAQLARRERAPGIEGRYLALLLAAILAAVPFGALPGSTEAADREEEPDSDLHVYDATAERALNLLSGPNDFILTDHPYIAALARRLVPPGLVDPSRGRTRAGVLTGQDVLNASQEYDVRLVLTWADRLRRLAEVPPWLEREHQLSYIFGARSVKTPRGAKDRSVYIRRDADLAAARERLEQDLAIREHVRFDERLELLGLTISDQELRVNSSEQVVVTVGFQAITTMPADYHITLQLVDEQGEIRSEQEHDIEGGARGTSTWQPGRWLFRSLAVQPEPRTGAGLYRLELTIVDPRSDKPLKARVASDAVQIKPQGERAITIGTLRLV